MKICKFSNKKERESERERENKDIKGIENLKNVCEREGERERGVHHYTTVASSGMNLLICKEEIKIELCHNKMCVYECVCVFDWKEESN